MSTSNNSSLNSHSHRSTGSTSTTTGGGGGGGTGGSGGGGGGGGGTTTTPTQACAACKYQRRKCNPDCTLAPYFPADHQRYFLNAHRLFGVSNILKIIRTLDRRQRPEAMSSIIYQSNVRAQDPVGGCYRIVLELERQIARDTAELELVLRQLDVCRAQAQMQIQQQHQHSAAVLPDLDMNSSHLIDQTNNSSEQDDNIYLDNGQNGHVGMIPYLQGGPPPPPQLHQGPTPPHLQSFYHHWCSSDNNNDNHTGEMEAPLSSSSLINGNNGGGGSMLQQQAPYQEDDDDAKPMFDMSHQAFFTVADEEEDSKDASSFLSSSVAKVDMNEEPNPMEHIQEHDLKGAASLFTLTNCNTSGV